VEGHLGHTKNLYETPLVSQIDQPTQDPWNIIFKPMHAFVFKDHVFNANVVVLLLHY